MSEKIHVPADLQELCFIFEDSSCEHRSCLDLKTGEINIVEEGFGERYITIPNAESYEGYQDVEDFIETVKEVKLRKKLYNGITRKGTFRRFKDVLNYYPKDRERRFRFKHEKLMERVNEWLKDEGIEIIPKNPIE